eukprot:gnl/MRDRNA2_/MRDRNA2_248445_c0_seq1.p1 gnl/MRDRNA2_/MRDRNA2_248445_c0~~gnl/MRDRNA2_/MRDRNA2_248445_c0_seq1.p1  ORF type:complete len:260 (+),score=68.46 gnl/MRDRNA2_/MRDRNA2_248445_c0_seq1:75-854(+)
MADEEELRTKRECCNAVQSMFSLCKTGIPGVLQSVVGRRNTLLQLHNGDCDKAVAAAAADQGVEEREVKGLLRGEAQLFKEIHACYKSGKSPEEIAVHPSQIPALQELVVGRVMLRMVSVSAPDHAKSLYLKYWKKLRKYSVIAALLGHDMTSLPGVIGVMKVMAGTADQVPDLWLQEVTFAAAFEEHDGLWDNMKKVFAAEKMGQPAGLYSDEATDIQFLREQTMPLADEELSKPFDPEPSTAELIKSCYEFMAQPHM